MRKGWFNDNWKHSLAAKGIQTRYYRKKPSRLLRKSTSGLGQSPVAFEPVVPFQRGTMGQLKKSIRRADVLRSEDGPRLARLEKERDSLERSLANMRRDVDPDMRASMKEELKDRNEAIAALMVLPKGSKADIELGERAVDTSAKLSRARSMARPGEVSEAQKAAAGLSRSEADRLSNVERRSGKMGAGEELLPKSGTKQGTRTMQAVLEARQKRQEAQRLGAAESKELQRPKKFERVEFEDDDQEKG